VFVGNVTDSEAAIDAIKESFVALSNGHRVDTVVMSALSVLESGIEAMVAGGAGGVARIPSATPAVSRMDSTSSLLLGLSSTDRTGHSPRGVTISGLASPMLGGSGANSATTDTNFDDPVSGLRGPRTLSFQSLIRAPSGASLDGSLVPALSRPESKEGPRSSLASIDERKGRLQVVSSGRREVLVPLPTPIMGAVAPHLLRSKTDAIDR